VEEDFNEKLSIEVVGASKTTESRWKERNELLCMVFVVRKVDLVSSVAC
jgi:hypothetical protein